MGGAGHQVKVTAVAEPMGEKVAAEVMLQNHSRRSRKTKSNQPPRLKAQCQPKLHRHHHLHLLQQTHQW